MSKNIEEYPIRKLTNNFQLINFKYISILKYIINAKIDKTPTGILHQKINALVIPERTKYNIFLFLIPLTRKLKLKSWNNKAYTEDQAKEISQK